MTPQESEPPLESLRQQTVGGVLWSLAARGTKVAIQFVISVVLARLLTPEDFGLVGMIAVFTGFAMLFNDLGFGAALVQKEELEERHRSSLFWLNCVAGLLLSGLVFASAPLLASFYEEPRLVPLTQLISANFFLGSLNVVQGALLKRNLEFRRLAYVEVVSVVAAGAVAIGLALTGFGVWALVWQMLVATAVAVAMMWVVSSWLPAARFELDAARELFGFSANLLGFRSFNYWVRSADDLLVGRIVGSHGLGVYTRAYESMLMPLRQVSNVVGRVMFPSLSRIQRDPERVRRAYLRAIAMIALVTFPMMTGLFVVADSFVLGLLGPKWVEVIPILRVLCLVGLAQSVGTTTGWIYQSQGRTDWMFRWGIVSGVVTLVAFAVGIRWGVMGVAVAYATRNFALTYFNFSIPGRLIDMEFSDVARAVAPAAGHALLMALIVWGCQLALPEGLPKWGALGVNVTAGATVYAVLMWSFRPDAFEDLLGLLGERLDQSRT